MPDPENTPPAEASAEDLAAQLAAANAKLAEAAEANAALEAQLKKAKSAGAAPKAKKAGELLVTVKFGTVHHAPAAPAFETELERQAYRAPAPTEYGPGDSFAIPASDRDQFDAAVAAGTVEIA